MRLFVKLLRTWGGFFEENDQMSISGGRRSSWNRVPGLTKFRILEPGSRIQQFWRILGNSSSIRRYFQSWNQVPE
jgi:hypothetical protein